MKYPPELFQLSNRQSRYGTVVLILLLQCLVPACAKKSPASPPIVLKPTPPPVHPASPGPPPAPAPQPKPTEARGKTAGEIEEILPAPSPDTDRAGPSIRIGLSTTSREVRISAADDFYLVEKAPEAERQKIKGEFQVRVEREVQESSEVYRLQVASLANAEDAENLGRTLAEKFSMPVVTRLNPSTRTTQVRLGAFSTRGEAESFARGDLSAAGYSGALLVRETTASGGGSARLAVRGPENFFRLSSAGFLFSPGAGTSFLRLDGKPYRGVLNLGLNKNGRMTVVNQLGMEGYLYGVVPSEISPTAYPELAALAAQAVAARTYALKNMGRFNSEGFDLTADETTQVYGGVSAEKPATNAAVSGTCGLALYYHGELINAMYSSTCGGRTEDFSNVFDGAPVPYLTSVFCTVESGAPEVGLKGEHDLDDVLFADDGSPANRNLELAGVLALPEGRTLTAEYLRGKPTAEEIRAWVRRARELAGKPSSAPSPQAREIQSRAGFLRYAAESFFGTEEIVQRVSPGDAAYYLGNLKDGDQLPRPEAAVFTYLMQKGLWRPYPDNSIRAAQPILRSDALSALSRWLESARPDILKTGIFAGAGSPLPGTREVSISVKWGNRAQQFPLAREVRLFRRADERSTPVDTLKVIGNEKVRFHVRPDGKIDFLEVELNPTGASSDRFSPLAMWQTTLSRKVIAEKLRPLVSGIGEVRDLEPARLGNSGRAVRIRVTGSRGSTILNGNRVRIALGLKDTLFTITRAYNPEGLVESFTFNGRGWGHGVGLCQVGAFGMARAGLGFEDILKAYYKGVELRRAY